MANIVENNELIARFMGVDVDFDTTVYKDSKSTLRQYINNRRKSDGLRFHTSWDWLMPVVEKIENTHMPQHGFFVVHISSNNCTIQGIKFNPIPAQYYEAYFSGNHRDTKMQSTYAVVIQFINWYNSQPKTNKP